MSTQDPPATADAASTTPSSPRRWRKIVSRVLGGIGLAIAAFILFVVAMGWTAFGKAPAGQRLKRMQANPYWKDGTFENRRPLWNDILGSITGASDSSPVSSPSAPIEVAKTRALLNADKGPLRVTWLGHSTVLIELEGLTILTDPVFGERTAPVSFAGPKRWYAPPLPLEEMPKIDVVLISHDHYDHLDAPTMQALAKRSDILYLAPLGIGAHLEYWGIASEAIHEHQWGESEVIKGITFHCTEARHASGRQVLDQNRTLWSSWAILGATKRVFYTGDTGFFPEFKDIGDAFGPFDVVMMEAGAYNKSWPDWHIGPEQAVKAYRLLKGKTLLPIHWGLFDLAMHGWTEPVERILVEAAKTNEVVMTPRPGEPIDMRTPYVSKRWWPNVAWKTGAEAPIVSRGVDGTLPNLYPNPAPPPRVEVKTDAPAATSDGGSPSTKTDGAAPTAEGKGAAAP